MLATLILRRHSSVQTIPKVRMLPIERFDLSDITLSFPEVSLFMSPFALPFNILVQRFFIGQEDEDIPVHLLFYRVFVRVGGNWISYPWPLE